MVEQFPRLNDDPGPLVVGRRNRLVPAWVAPRPLPVGQLLLQPVAPVTPGCRVGPCYDDLITEGWHLLASCTVWAQWSRNEALASTDEVS